MKRFHCTTKGESGRELCVDDYLKIHSFFFLCAFKSFRVHVQNIVTYLYINMPVHHIRFMDSVMFMYGIKYLLSCPGFEKDGRLKKTTTTKNRALSNRAEFKY